MPPGPARSPVSRQWASAGRGLADRLRPDPRFPCEGDTLVITTLDRSTINMPRALRRSVGERGESPRPNSARRGRRHTPMRGTVVTGLAALAQMELEIKARTHQQQREQTPCCRHGPASRRQHLRRADVKLEFGVCRSVGLTGKARGCARIDGADRCRLRLRFCFQTTVAQRAANSPAVTAPTSAAGPNDGYH